MAFNLKKANKIALEVTNKYQNLKYKNTTVPVPYFINTAEQEYKKAMTISGLESENISKIINIIKTGKTSLGAHGGKGSPRELEKDLERLSKKLESIDYEPTNIKQIRKWMIEMHIGLDCSGYVFNIFEAIEKMQKIPILKLFAWKDNTKIKPSHAGAYIFDSENLTDITEKNKLMPLDVLVWKNHTHAGIILERNNELYFVDCSMTRNGIHFHEIQIINDSLVIPDSPKITERIKNNEIKFKRLPYN